MRHEKKESEPGIAACAAALEAELQRFESLAVAVQHGRLNSEKHLKRSADTLAQLVESDARLAAQVEQLLAALNAARERQQGHADAVQKRAEEIKRRSEVLAQLLDRCQRLQTVSAGLNRELQGMAASGASNPVDLRSALQVANDRLLDLIEQARALMEAADAEAFDDVSRQADSLRAQLTALRRNIGRLSGSTNGSG